MDTFGKGGPSNEAVPYLSTSHYLRERVGIEKSNRRSSTSADSKYSLYISKYVCKCTIIHCTCIQVKGLRPKFGIRLHYNISNNSSFWPTPNGSHSKF